MARKRKQTTKSGLRKRSKSKSVQKEKEKLSLPELSNLDKNVNRVLSENWRLLKFSFICFFSCDLHSPRRIIIPKKLRNSSRENFKTVKADHNQRMSPGFQMGMHRWEAILDAIKLNVAEFITLSEFQNKARLIQDRSYRLMMESYHLT